MKEDIWEMHREYFGTYTLLSCNPWELRDTHTFQGLGLGIRV